MRRSTHCSRLLPSGRAPSGDGWWSCEDLARVERLQQEQVMHHSVSAANLNIFSSLTVFVHAAIDAPSQAARPTLVAMCLVNGTTLVLRLADVLSVATDRTLEEAGAPASDNRVMTSPVCVQYGGVVTIVFRRVRGVGASSDRAHCAASLAERCVNFCL